ncbi:piggyBac transposable element derived 1 [Cricetulus griseus]
MHITSLQYAAGDITQKGKERDKSRMSELLQGLTFSDDSEAEEDSEPEGQPQRKKRKVPSVPEKSWTKRDIKPNFPTWSALDSGLLNLKSEKLNPVELFELFFDDETFNLIVNETNNYSSQKNFSLEVTVQEMLCVFGVLLWSGLVRHPRKGMYWEISDCDQTLVRNAIKRDKFELIFSYLHFADNSHLDQKDKFSKLRPLIKQMNKNFLLHAPPEEYYCFDKSMCECFDSDQFLNGKPLRIGYKVWCGTTTQDYLGWFEPHQEDSTVETDKELDLGLGGNLIMSFVDVLLQKATTKGREKWGRRTIECRYCLERPEVPRAPPPGVGLSDTFVTAGCCAVLRSRVGLGPVLLQSYSEPGCLWVVRAGQNTFLRGLAAPAKQTRWPAGPIARQGLGRLASGRFRVSGQSQGVWRWDSWVMYLSFENGRQHSFAFPGDKVSSKVFILGYWKRARTLESGCLVDSGLCYFVTFSQFLNLSVFCYFRG